MGRSPGDRLLYQLTRLPATLTAFVARLNLSLRQQGAAMGRRSATPCKSEDSLGQQLARLLGAAMAAAILVVCLGVFLVRWLFFRRPLDLRREERPGAGDAPAHTPYTSR